ncbi:MAG TPA: hypothetical protein EYP16_00870, partial [Candidatus Atribacteria bacterium]|nr:hypothetical protein [Candidatus Atribacteria bacterium]
MLEISRELLDEARNIHRESIIIDAHCDTVLQLAPRKGREEWKTRSLIERGEFGHIDIPRLFEGGVTCQFFAIYVEGIYKPERATERALELISTLYTELEKASDKTIIVDKHEDIIKAKRRGKIAIL